MMFVSSFVLTRTPWALRTSIVVRCRATILTSPAARSSRLGSGRVALVFFFFQAEDGIRDPLVTGVQTCALPILAALSAFDNGGHRIYAHPIVKIVDTSGKPLAAFPENTVGGQVITPQLAYVMTDILHGVPGKELGRSEEHTSELQSRVELVCRLL